MARATVGDCLGQTLHLTEPPAAADRDDRIVYFHEEYDDSGGPPRVVFAADSLAIADGLQEYKPELNRRMYRDSEREAERRDIVEELKRLEMLEEAAAEEGALQATGAVRDEKYQLKSVRTENMEASKEFAALARGFLNKETSSRTLTQTQTRTPSQSDNNESIGNRCVQTPKYSSIDIKKLTSNEPCSNRLNREGSVLQKKPTSGPATVRPEAKNDARGNSFVHEEPAPVIKPRKKQVTFADPCITGFCEDVTPSDIKRVHSEGAESRQSISCPGPQPPTVVWTAPGYCLSDEGSESSLQHGVLQAVEEAVQGDEDLEPSDRLAFIENLLRLEAEEDLGERSDGGESVEDLDSCDGEFDIGSTRLDLKPSPSVKMQNGAVGDAAADEYREFGSGFISHIVAPSGYPLSEERTSSMRGSSANARSGEPVGAFEADRRGEALQTGTSVPSDDLDVDGRPLVSGVHTPSASSPQTIEEVIPPARSPSSPFTTKAPVGFSPSGVCRQRALEQNETTIHCDRNSCSNSGKHEEEVRKLEPMSDVVRERTTASRRSRPKRRPLPQLGMQVPVLESAGSCIRRGSVAFPEESDAIYVDDEDEDLERPRPSRFKALQISTSRARA